MPEIEDIAVGAWPRAPTARSCDACTASAATLHCGVCAAFLCVRCDGRVHGLGDRALPLHHGRVWMCEVCEKAPAAVTCEADAAALCSPCDADIHAANPLSGRHNRVPAIPFYESVVRHRSLSSPFSEEEEMKSKSVDFIFPEVVDPFLEVDYSPHMHTSFRIIQTTSTITSTTTDSVVPVVLQGKIDDASSLPFLTSSSSLDFDHHPPNNNQYYSFTLTNVSLNQSISSPSPCLDVGVVPRGTNISFSEGTAEYSAAAAGMDREARVLRYREKRKNRKFEKTIRYASRKAYAESRPRIKGRFAKRTESEVEASRLYSSAVAFLAADSGFGVVPS